ncbi:hypothetical protein [Methylacidiphilum caldifontis]|uniref:Uncharacterized protein n=1 Tax=Methylacidiphilum caldifontis TaxID=2795386 RepID=A0A4Y8PBN3_9BACT|nr:hypothetical protein [Methylacidiphilum caldifontis]QSR88140.1 hypothetical protein IT6_07050 [Methylacidiphilum caldifontis]TFE68178.1 hypothetical protein A7Q10_00625 [Methylacidiphilum caldifontis]
MKNRIKDFYPKDKIAELNSTQGKQEWIILDDLAQFEEIDENKEIRTEEKDSPLIIDLGLGKPIVIPSREKKMTKGILIFLFLIFPLLLIFLPLGGVFIFSLFSHGHLCWHQKVGFLSGLAFSLLIFGLFLRSIVKKIK